MFSKSIGLCTGLCLLFGAFAGAPSATAQESGAKVTPPPKVLEIELEFLKPGKSGSPHQKTESAFIAAAEKSKTPIHYLAAQAVSGPPRTIFTFGYDSFAEFEKQLKEETSGPIAGDLDAAYQADGELLESTSRSLFVLHDDMSLNAPCAIGTMRFFQITRVKLHPGQMKNWQEFLKMWKDAVSKTDPDAHIAVFSEAYGMESGGVWLLIHPMKSLSEVDRIQATNETFRKNVSDWDHYQELLRTMVDSTQSNLYSFDPTMSFVPDEWASQDPTFWKRK